MKIGKSVEAGLKNQGFKRTDKSSLDIELRDQVLASLQKAAKNGDGKVSRKEIIAAVKNAQNSRASVEGGPSNSDFRKALKEHLALIDFNGDGEVSIKKANKAMKRAEAEMTQASASTESDFQAQLATQLNRFSVRRSSKFSERETFAALAAVAVEKEGGTKALIKFYNRFNQALQEDKGDTRKALNHGVNRAIKRARVLGYFDNDTAHQIRNEAFGAAQLDFNKLALGSQAPAVDETYSLDTVLESAEEQQDKYDNGVERAMTRPERKVQKKLISVSEDEET